MNNWITTKIELDADKNEIRRFICKTSNFDSKGIILDETEYDSEKNVISQKFYRYFDSGNVKEYIEVGPNSEILERQLYTMDDYGEIYKLEQEVFGANKTIKEIIFTDIENAEKSIIKDDTGEIIGYELFIYDEHGQVIEEIELDADNNELSKYQKTYLENGLLKNEKHYLEGTLETEEYFEYDDKENLIKETYKNHIVKNEVINEYDYDNNGNLICNSAYQKDKLVFLNKCGYNEESILVLEEFYELDYWQNIIIRHERLEHTKDIDDAQIPDR